MMKKISLKTILLYGFSFILLACNNYQKEFKQINELDVRIKALKNSFYTIDLGKVHKAKEVYKENMSSIKKYYNEDTVDANFGITLNHYKAIKKLGKNIDSDYIDNETAMLNMEKTLTHLRKDISNGLIIKDSVSIFIEFEKAKTDELSERIGTFIENCQRIVTTHDSLSEKVKSYTYIF